MAVSTLEGKMNSFIINVNAFLLLHNMEFTRQMRSTRRPTWTNEITQVVARKRLHGREYGGRDE